MTGAYVAPAGLNGWLGALAPGTVARTHPVARWGPG